MKNELYEEKDNAKLHPCTTDRQTENFHNTCKIKLKLATFKFLASNYHYEINFDYNGKLMT